MKKLTRKSLNELAKTMSVLNESERLSFIGGGTESCVFNCFDYFDSDRYSAGHYYANTLSYLQYEPADNGGVSTSDIGKIGSFGGLSVNAISSNVALSSNGTLRDGSSVMMTFNKDGIDHAVVVTGFKREGGVLKILYYDPTYNTDGFRINNEYSGLYSVRDELGKPLGPSGNSGTSDNYGGTSGNSGTSDDYWGTSGNSGTSDNYWGTSGNSGFYNY